MDGAESRALLFFISARELKRDHPKRTIRPTKKWKRLTSKVETSREPYQNTSAITKKLSACVNPYSALLQIADLFDLRIGSSKLSLYIRKQSSSLVKDATVRIAPAASQAS